MSDAMPHGKGNSLSPEPCALIPDPVIAPLFIHRSGGKSGNPNHMDGRSAAGFGGSR